MKRIVILHVTFVVFLGSGALAIEASEYFGEFGGQPQLEVELYEKGRPTSLLLNNFSLTDPNGLTWTVPKAWSVDGAPIPRVAWSRVGGPLSGRNPHASIIHYSCCYAKTRTAHDTHRNFNYGMPANEVSQPKDKAMYWVVRTFAPSWRIFQGSISSWISEPTQFLMLTTETVLTSLR